MKLATVTFHCAYNYGAVLQAYALVQALSKLGHDACVLDYWPAHRIKASESVWYRRLDAKGLIINGLIAFNYLSLKKKRLKFDIFREKLLNTSKDRYYCYDDILRAQDNYDAFVVGSDQVWNPDTGLDPVYFLDFSRDVGSRSIAYAPSIGLPRIEEKYRAEMTRLISRVDVLSSREHRGTEIIKELTGRESEVVVDPVLLLSMEDWRKIVVPMDIPDKYILVYVVRRRRYMEKSINQLKKKLNLPVVLIVGSNPAARGWIDADYIMTDAGPQEFVSLFSRATYVCTNSFHGTAFSLIFAKPFLTFPHTKGDSRVASILKRAEMDGNIVYENEPYRTNFNNFISSKNLKEEINGSLMYLRDSLV